MQSPTGGGPGPGTSRACGVCGEEAYGWLHCRQGVGAPQQPLEAAGVAGEPPNQPGAEEEREWKSGDAGRPAAPPHRLRQGCWSPSSSLYAKGGLWLRFL